MNERACRRNTDEERMKYYHSYIYTTKEERKDGERKRIKGRVEEIKTKKE